MVDCLLFYHPSFNNLSNRTWSSLIDFSQFSIKVYWKMLIVPFIDISAKLIFSNSPILSSSQQIINKYLIIYLL